MKTVEAVAPPFFFGIHKVRARRPRETQGGLGNSEKFRGPLGAPKTPRGEPGNLWGGEPMVSKAAQGGPGRPRQAFLSWRECACISDLMCFHVFSKDLTAAGGHVPPAPVKCSQKCFGVRAAVGGHGPPALVQWLFIFVVLEPQLEGMYLQLRLHAFLFVFMRRTAIGGHVPPARVIGVSIL